MDFPVRVIPDASFDFFPPGGCSVLLVPFLGGSVRWRHHFDGKGGQATVVRGKPFLGGGGDPVKKRF